MQGYGLHNLPTVQSVKRLSSSKLTTHDIIAIFQSSLTNTVILNRLYRARHSDCPPFTTIRGDNLSAAPCMGHSLNYMVWDNPQMYYRVIFFSVAKKLLQNAVLLFV